MPKRFWKHRIGLNSHLYRSLGKRLRHPGRCQRSQHCVPRYSGRRRAATDPFALGLVAKLTRPGGNLTGATLGVDSFFSKGIELLQELLPQASSVTLMTNSTNPVNLAIRQVESAAQTRGQTVVRTSRSRTVSSEVMPSGFLTEKILATFPCSPPRRLSWS